MTLVTVDELSDYMSTKPVGASQTAAAQLIIDGVQNELEMYINRPLESRINRELVYTDTVGFARLQATPVISVTKVSYISQASLVNVDGNDIPIDRLPVDSSMETVDITPTNLGRGLIREGGVHLGAPKTYFVVEYVGGGGDLISQYLPSIKIAILRVASREWEHLHKDNVRINNSEIGDDVDPGVAKLRGWDESELKKFDRIRRRVII